MLRTGAFYRINYLGWKTTPQPIIFVLYAGPMGNKVHGLYLNSNTNSKAEFVRFLAVIKQLSNSDTIIRKDPRTLYRILKKYCPNFIRTSYRTLFRHKLNKHGMISYGLVKEEEISEQEKITNSYMMYAMGKRMYQSKVLDSVISEKKVENEFYKPTPKPTKTVETDIKSKSTGNANKTSNKGVNAKVTKETPNEGINRKSSMYHNPSETAPDKIEGY